MTLFGIMFTIAQWLPHKDPDIFDEGFMMALQFLLFLAALIGIFLLIGFFAYISVGSIWSERHDIVKNVKKNPAVAAKTAVTILRFLK